MGSCLNSQSSSLLTSAGRSRNQELIRGQTPAVSPCCQARLKSQSPRILTWIKLLRCRVQESICGQTPASPYPAILQVVLQLIHAQAFWTPSFLNQSNLKLGWDSSTVVLLQQLSHFCLKRYRNKTWRASRGLENQNGTASAPIPTVRQPVLFNKLIKVKKWMLFTFSFRWPFISTWKEKERFHVA